MQKLSAASFAFANAIVVVTGVVALCAAASAVLSGCAQSGKQGFAGVNGEPVSISISADATVVPADGISIVTVTAAVANAAEGTTITFAKDGIGLLSESNVVVVNGKATVELWAPFESEVTPDPQFTSTVTALIPPPPGVSAPPVQDTLDVTFTLPTTGEPTLSAHTAPDIVVAGGDEPITLFVDGRRLTSSTVTLTAEPEGIVTLPATLTLEETSDGVFHHELVILPAAEPAEVVITLTTDGAPPVTATLHFRAEDAPAFNLTGSFAQVQYGGLRLGNLVFLDPDPQCVVTPSFALTHVTQTGSHLVLETEVCEVNMPTVNVILIGEMGTHVGPGFVRAINEAAGPPLEFDLDNVGPGATFEAPPTPATTVGAHMEHPDDPLPTSADDPRVWDADGDGNPGVTIAGDNSIVGDNYTVNRTLIASLTGTIQSSDLVTGMEEDLTDSTVVNGGGGGLSPEVTSLPSPWFMARVDGVNGAPNIAGRDGDSFSVSCADVQAYEEELMALYPAPPQDCPN